MHNTSSNTNPFADSTDWAKQFVPLPPTEFPPETSDFQRNSEGDSGAAELPVPQANLPCLEAIAGVDPFFTPAESSIQPPHDLVGDIGTSVSTEPSAATAINSSHDFSQSSTGSLSCPAVEVIGQQADQTQNTSPKQITAESLLHEKNPEANSMKNQNQARPTVEIHEYDLAMKVLPQKDTPDTANNPNLQAGVGTNESGSEFFIIQQDSDDPTGNDIASYWCQNNVSSFVPGVTPIEAYPVCRDFEEQIAVACNTKLAEVNDTEQTQASQPEPVALQETQAENTSDGVCEISSTEEQPCTAENSNAGAELSNEPLQADPFENDAFETVYQVAQMKSENRNLPTTSVPAAPAAASDKLETAQEEGQLTESNSSEAVESINCEPASEAIIEQATEPVALEIAALQIEAQVEPVAEATQTTSPPLDVTQSLPQWPNNGFMSSPTSSYQLFDSVEKSLSDLQSINQLEQQETFSPVVNALVGSPSQLEPNATTPVEEPAPAAPPACTENSCCDAVSEATDNLSSTPQLQEQLVSIEQTEKAELSATAQSQVTTESTAVEPPAIAHNYDTVVASTNPPVQQTPPVFEPVNLTAQLPMVPAESPIRAAEPSTPVQTVEQTTVQAAHVDESVEMQNPPQQTAHEELPTPLPQPTPAIDIVELNAETPTATTQQTAPTMHAEAVEQTPVEAAPVAELVEMQPPAYQPEPTSQETPAATAPDPETQVIEVDGNNGYDFLDLKAFDVANAIFTPGAIFLDDGQNKFQIKYYNIKHAVFANDFQVELN